MEDLCDVGGVQLHNAVVDIKPVPPRDACLREDSWVVICYVHSLADKKAKDHVRLDVALDQAARNVSLVRLG